LRSFEFEHWDNGRLTVNCDVADLFRRNGLAKFDDFMKVQGVVAKDFLAERTTLRFRLADADGNDQNFYIKRHSPSSWKEYVKPLLRFRLPILGARHEWDAILRFHRAGINTMTPAALGESDGYSVLVTRSLEDCGKVSHWLRGHYQNGHAAQPTDTARRSAIGAVARLAHQMHARGLHHQDFYLHHLLRSTHEEQEKLYVIDLGRACHRPHLARRWIVKDLAQLSYSVPECSRTERFRFLKAYFGRRLRPADRRIVQQIERKVQQIARHSHRHSL
jgi:heptose I phosphotransferase